MNPTERERLIDEYFAALDEPNYDALRTVFDSDVEYLFPDAPPVHGLETAIRFFEHEKPTSNTDHEVDRYLHTGEVTVAEGYATGDVGSDPFASHFCDVVEFTDEGSRISRLAVYSRPGPTPSE